MKVSDLIESLQGLDPNESVCAVIWTKAEFDYDNDDEVFLDEEGWDRICKEFYESQNVTTRSIAETLADAVTEYAIEKKPETATSI
jgi:hypothetical protein